MSAPDPQPAHNLQLFDAAARALAEAQPDTAPFHWLALSDDPEALHLRAALQRGFELSGDAALRLANGLATERWGQHVGALAQLLMLALLDAEGLSVRADPHLDGQRPDVLVRRDGLSALIEVRAVTGMGRRPWVERARRRGGDDRPEDPDALRQVLHDVVLDKAAAYRRLVGRYELPYVIALYCDTDGSLPPLLRDVAFGPATEFTRRADRWGQSPGGGLLAARRDELDHVSALAVFGRRDDDDGRLRLTGELLLNPDAVRVLPVELRPTGWRVLDREPGADASTPGARMVWTSPPLTPRAWGA